MECGATIDLARSLGLVPVGQWKDAQWLVMRVLQMLSGLKAQVGKAPP